MEASLSTWIDPELRQAPPRAVFLKGEGVRTFFAWTAPVALLLAVAAALFFSQPQPLWVTALFAVFVITGVAVLWRLVALWSARASLVRSGIAAGAIVICKEPARLGAAHYYAWYEAAGRQWGIGWAGGRNDADVGDAISVLHSPDRPGEAVVYRWSGCAAKRLTRV